MDKVLIIAEAGVNHNGSLEMALQLVDAAASAGADIVKFQTAKLGALVTKHALMAEYQENNTGVRQSQKDMLATLLLPYKDFVTIRDYCDQKGIIFLSTPFDIESILFLNELVPFWKIPSGEITNFPYLREIGKTKKPVVLSTGMSTLDEIRAAIDVLREYGTEDIRLLHCTTEYPAPYEDVNLRAIETMRREFNLEVGYSDHTTGLEISFAAVALGATIIEKHFTLDRNLSGPDHVASITPLELRQLVEGIRKIELARGSGEKEPSNAEIKNISIARKSIVANCDIKKGDIFTEINLAAKRPGNGISPMHWNDILGKVALRDYDEDDLIEYGE